MENPGIGLVGAGRMGKCHALAWNAVRPVFGDVPVPRLEMLCEQTEELAREKADQFGFARSTDEWRTLVDDPEIDIVVITTPNSLHAEIAIAALAAGKHVHCEKPMGLTLADAIAMQQAAEAAGKKTIVGYNYLSNPAYIHAQQLILGGAIGRPVHFRGFVDEDYQADPEIPWTWRSTRAGAGLGSLGDIGCNLISMMHGLMGPVESLTADTDTIHSSRPTMDGQTRREVENEDVASALLRFESGVTGVISTSRSAWGRKNHLAFEVHGTAGMLVYDQERMNELQIYQRGGAPGEEGFKTILTGPAHPPYEQFSPVAGHQIGFNDLKTIEVHRFLTAIATDTPAFPSFADALAIERVIHTIADAKGKVWLKPAQA